MMKKNIIVTIAFAAILLVIVGLLWFEETRMVQGNWREGTSFANLEVGNNLIIESVSLTFLGETQVNCDDFPEKAKEECKKSKFFAFQIKGSEVPLSVYQGHNNVYIALEGTKLYYKNTTIWRNPVVISNNGSLFVDSPTGFYELKYRSIRFNGNITEFAIETLKKS
ncbi:hypothetical protein KKE99_05445 [Patescibacteria group bacterium]|nr:hypothetical protein [Patescibacteria group bacterium]